MIRCEHFVTVHARRLSGSQVVVGLEEVKPNFASGLTAIDAISLREAEDVDRRSDGSAWTGSREGRRL